jgi:hypothetical protein
MPNYTLSYSEGAQGWPSFYSFYPDYMIGMNNYFYSFKGGELYRHNVNESRNTFYQPWFVKIGNPAGATTPAMIQSVFNVSPLENKLFKTINLEGDAPWQATLATDLQASGYIQILWFEKKEASYFAFIRNTSVDELYLRSANGIGRSVEVTGSGSAVEVNFPVNPNPIVIGSILSVGDYLYYNLPPTFSSPILFGVVTDIVVDYPNDVNKIIVNTTIPGATIPGIEDPFIMYVKNSVAESHGVLGHYCVFTLQSFTIQKVELFAVESEVMKSYP